MNDLITSEEWEQGRYDCLEQLASHPPPALEGKNEALRGDEESHAPRGRLADVLREGHHIGLEQWTPRLA
jgi:hypothetical protein